MFGTCMYVLSTYGSVDQISAMCAGGQHMLSSYVVYLVTVDFTSFVPRISQIAPANPKNQGNPSNFTCVGALTAAA